jgi:serine/threonine-protein kinase
MRRLELESQQKKGGDPKELEAIHAENARLHARVQNLESIVVNVDFELNQRLLRLAESTSMAGTKGESALLAQIASAPNVAMPLAPGSVVAGRYHIEAEVGRGGMGIVYRARDSELGETVALKVIAPHLGSDPQVVERFRREVGAARRVTHPNVVRIHDLGQADGRLFLSMEWFPGPSLEERLDAGRVLSLQEARNLLLPVCDGLEAAHRAGVVHRDLKTRNILVRGDADVKIIDFGLAQATGSVGLTATGILVGTPEYMAPEQVRGLTQDERTDIYAMGVVLYRALCGKLPFSGPNPIAVGFAQISEPPQRPTEIRPELPVAVEAVILRALAKEPRYRYPHAHDLKAALEKVL